MRLTGKYQVRGKVVIGFILAFFLVLGISAVTYFSIRNLLDTVQDLTRPNEKLQQLNGLMADVYVLDINKTERTSDKDSVSELARKRVKERLEWLKTNSLDSAEIQNYEQVGLTISELMVVFAGLEEVRNYLANRNFSAEALKGIEIRIKRQQELSDMQFLGKLRTKDLLSSLNPKSEESDSIGKESKEPERSNEFDIGNELLEIAKDIKKSGTVVPPSVPPKSTNQDSILLVIRNSVERIYKDEQRLQDRFLKLEENLIEKNTDIFFQIQQMISNLQNDLLKEYKVQNRSAYKLTYTVSWILGILVFFGVAGSLGFVFSILQEVDKADLYGEKLEEAKIRSDKLAKTKQEFLANMSHEIRNPLHAIQGYQKALEKSDLHGQQKEFVERIGFASNTLIAVVNDILDFSKLEAGQVQVVKEPFESKDFFLSIKNFFALKAEQKGLYFNWNIDLPQNQWLVGDQLRINQIMNNLLGNSLKFTQKGGIVVDITWVKKHLEIKIADTGMGMTAEIRKNIFKEFNQGDSAINRKFGGTGLGLAIVKKLIDKLGGTIQVSTEVDKGTIISFTIPCEVIEPISKQSEHTFEFSLQGLRILLVDDDPLGLQLLKLILESRGAMVSAIQGGAAFSREFVSDEIDIAIIDIQMPEVSGLEVVKIIRANEKFLTLPIIAMTANVFVEEERKIAEAGFDGLILKPFKENEIVKRIGLMLGLTQIAFRPENPTENQVEIKSDLETTDYDLSDLMRFCMGDREMLLEVIQDFINAAKEDVRGLNLALENSDFGKILEIIHRMSSRLGQLKISCAQLAMEIERDLKLGKTVETIESIRELAKYTTEIMAKIQSEWMPEPAK
ncbi:ATP-binding protein [Cognataquiflexum rubidum]|uniref:hybrid sensor histidine kinase/response regulator n=1 Tax=Cognataquiflexum rubidum TaxID=2922273 RepID=UPI001F145834|nr:ATP-binding protein [Cognataquiflexum rubidum]MCH6233465.1 ATP-binding protein [Cognataquiflexum rubidum]